MFDLTYPLFLLVFRCISCLYPSPRPPAQRDCSFFDSFEHLFVRWLCCCIKDCHLFHRWLPLLASSWNGVIQRRWSVYSSVVTCFTFSYSTSCPSVQRTWSYYTWSVATKVCLYLRSLVVLELSPVRVLVLLTCVLSPQNSFPRIDFLSHHCHRRCARLARYHLHSVHCFTYSTTL